jgi:hypothetical protein
VLNGDCKSHWFTNEEIKDGKKKEIYERDDRFSLPDTFPVCLEIYRKTF